MADLIIKEVNNEEWDLCIDLLRRTYKGTSDESTFKWRFANPDSERPILVVAKEGDKIISFLSWIPWFFNYNGQNYLAYQAGEAATVVEYRKKGVWGKVLDFGHRIAMERNIDFLFGFPSTLSYNALYKAGYYPIATCFFHVRPINPFRKQKQNKLDKKSEYIVYPTLFQSDRITPVINEEYYTWRYINNTKEYVKLEYTENNNTAVFFCREKMWRKIPEVLLMDAQFTSYNEMFLDRAFRSLDEHYSGKALYIRTFFNNSSERGETLRRYFTYRIKSKYDIFIVRPVSARIDNNILLNFNCWDIMPHCVDEY